MINEKDIQQLCDTIWHLKRMHVSGYPGDYDKKFEALIRIKEYLEWEKQANDKHNETKFEYGKKYLLGVEENSNPIIFIADRVDLEVSQPDFARYVFLDSNGEVVYINEESARFVKKYEEPVKPVERTIDAYVVYKKNSTPLPALQAIDLLTGLTTDWRIFLDKNNAIRAKTEVASALDSIAKFRFTAVQLPDEE